VKKISIAIMLFLVVILAGCGSNGSPERLWNRYVAAMNSQDLDKVAAVYYPADSAEYNLFLESNTAEVYFADFDSIKTVRLKPSSSMKIITRRTWSSV
jgi:uncharacterized membrane protein YvbJ